MRRLARCLLVAGPFVAALWAADVATASQPADRRAHGHTGASLGGGDDHSCAVRTDGTVSCWGRDDFGQSSPPQETFASVAAGGDHSCGLRPDGTVSCWGRDHFGQSSPPPGSFVSVAAGHRHSCGVRVGGTVACWGSDENGESSPPPDVFVSVATGHGHSCGVRADGTVSCWGLNDAGQSSPPTDTFVSVAAGHWHSCGVRADGTLSCWGLNDLGQSSPPAGTFMSVTLRYLHACGVRANGAVACWGSNVVGESNAPAGAFVSVAVGNHHSCGVRAGGTLSCWGRDDDGRLDAPLGRFAAPVVAAGTYHTCGVRSIGTTACWGGDGSGQASSPPGTFVSLAAGETHSCGVGADRTVACWGANFAGQSTPPSGRFNSVAVGESHTCGVRSDGTVACWGSNGNGQSSPPAGSFVSVAAGNVHTCGVRSDGTVACWGWNGFGQSTPPSGTFVSVAGGYGHSCGVRSDATVACWGWNNSGQSTPAAGTFLSVATGLMHSCGIRTDSTIACWGRNSDGQSGAPAGTFVSLDTGDLHGCAVRTYGAVACWGWNGWGQANPPSLATYPLTAAVSATQTYGGTDVTFRVSYSGLMAPDTEVSGEPTCSASAHTADPVGTHAATFSDCGGLSSHDYLITYVSGSITVSEAPLTVTAEPRTRTYGAGDPPFTAAVSGFVLGEDVASSGVTGSAECATTATSASPVGEYPISCTTGSLEASNYAFTTFVDATLTVTKAALTVTADAPTRTYGAVDTFGATLSGFVLGEDLASSDVIGSAQCQSTATVSSPPGGYPISCTLGTLASSNYAFTTFVDGTLTVTKAPLTVTADPRRRTYGAGNPVFSATPSGFVLGEDPASAGVTGFADCATTAGTSSPAGTHPISCAVGSLEAPNYAFTTFVDGTLTVTKAHLTVTAESRARPFGTDNPPLTAVLSGFVLGEDRASSGVTGSAACATTATPSSPPGAYPISCAPGTLDASNYEFTSFVQGTLRVVEVATTMTAEPVVPNVFTLRATLTRADDGRPVVWRQVTFTAGGTSVCGPVLTDADGTATCHAVSPSTSIAAIVLSLGYTAEFAGDDAYLPSSADAGMAT